MKKKKVLRKGNIIDFSLWWLEVVIELEEEMDGAALWKRNFTESFLSFVCFFCGILSE